MQSLIIILSKRNLTVLSNFICDKKKDNVNANLDWSILAKAKPLLQLQKMHVKP